MFLVDTLISAVRNLAFILLFIYVIIYLQVISGHTGWVRSVAVEPGNQWFATGSADRTIKVNFNVSNGVVNTVLIGI